MKNNTYKNLGIRFLERCCEVSLEEFEKKPKDSDRRKRRIIRMIEHFIETGRIINHYCGAQEDGLDDFDEILDEYKNYRIQNNLPSVTIQYYTKYAKKFHMFLFQSGISSYDKMDIELINAFKVTLDKYTQKKMNNYTMDCCLGYLLRVGVHNSSQSTDNLQYIFFFILKKRPHYGIILKILRIG